jgi:hypothetical protein
VPSVPAAGGAAAGGLSSGGGGGGGGGVEHETSNPRIAASPAVRRRTINMWILFLEAFGAMVLLILIVWWTMFHGRKNGERDDR